MKFLRLLFAPAAAEAAAGTGAAAASASSGGAADAAAGAGKAGADGKAGAAGAGDKGSDAAGAKGAEAAAGDKGTGKDGGKAEETAKVVIPDKYDLKFRDNGPLSADMDFDAISARAKALGLSQEAAQTMVVAEEDAILAQSAAWLGELQADKELGGAKFADTQRFAVAGVDALFPKDSEEGALVRAFWNRSGLGNHPAFVRAMARHGRKVSEDSGSGHAASGGSGGEENKPEDRAKRLFPKS
jgi:hypothetical protein